MDSAPVHVKLPPSLEARRITRLPPAAYYIADFLSDDEEQAILHKVPSLELRPRLFISI
jgi:alkylated DNA repair protein alkB family protein 6